MIMAMIRYSWDLIAQTVNKECCLTPEFYKFNLDQAEILSILWLLHNAWQNDSLSSTFCSFISSHIKTTKL